MPRWQLRKKTQADQMRQPRMMEGQDSYTFRRSRTITGTTAERVHVAEVSDSHLKTPRMHLQELHLTRKRLVLRLGILLLLIATISYLLYEYTGMTRTLAYTVPPIVQPDNEAYIKTIHAYYTDNPLQQFQFSVDENSLSKYIQQEHPEVTSISVRRGSEGLEYLISLRQPRLSWTTRHGQFYVDATGTAFERNYYKEPTLKVDDKSGISDVAGSAVVSSRFIKFVGQMIAALERSGAGTVEQVILPPNLTHEVDIRITGRDFIIKTNIDRDPAGQAQDIANTLRYIQEKGIIPAYVDVRVEGKAFYRDK